MLTRAARRWLACAMYRWRHGRHLASALQEDPQEAARADAIVSVGGRLLAAAARQRNETASDARAFLKELSSLQERAASQRTARDFGSDLFALEPNSTRRALFHDT